MGRCDRRWWPINDRGAKFFPQLSDERAKKEKRSKKERKQRPVETAATVEIGKGGLRRLFLDDFHSWLKKPPQKTPPLFSQFQKATATDQHLCLRQRKT